MVQVDVSHNNRPQTPDEVFPELPPEMVHELVVRSLPAVKQNSLVLRAPPDVDRAHGSVHEREHATRPEESDSQLVRLLRSYRLLIEVALSLRDPQSLLLFRRLAQLRWQVAPAFDGHDRELVVGESLLERDSLRVPEVSVFPHIREVVFEVGVHAGGQRVPLQVLNLDLGRQRIVDLFVQLHGLRAKNRGGSSEVFLEVNQIFFTVRDPGVQVNNAGNLLFDDLLGSNTLDDLRPPQVLERVQVGDIQDQDELGRDVWVFKILKENLPPILELVGPGLHKGPHGLFWDFRLIQPVLVEAPRDLVRLQQVTQRVPAGISGVDSDRCDSHVLVNINSCAVDHTLRVINLGSVLVIPENFLQI